jgi:hypothetical protein
LDSLDYLYGKEFRGMNILVKEYGKIISCPFAKGWRLIYVPKKKKFVLVEGTSQSASITYHWFTKAEIKKLAKHIASVEKGV